MKPRKVIIFVVFLVFCLNQSAINKQAKNRKYQLIYVLEVHVIPPKIDEFESAVKMLIEHFKEFEFPRSVVGDITDDYCYYFSTPITNYADLDVLASDLDEIQKKMGADKSQDLRVRFKDAYESIRLGVILKRPDLSYVPINPRLSAIDARYMRMDAFYLLPGQESDFENICKAWSDLWQHKSISEPLNVYVGQMGTESPVYYLSIAGKDPADFWSHAGRTWGDNGKETQKLWKKILPLVRKWEFRTGWLRLDLTYWPKKKVK